MKTKKEAPDQAQPMGANISKYSQCVCMCHKDIPKLSKRQKKVAKLLLTGKYSAADITIALHYSDPRSYIRELRDKGINVQDEWVSHEDVRFKRYWIPQINPDVKSVGEILEENFSHLLNHK
jgi:hypothetical protein